MSYKQETTVYSVEERLPENGKLVRAYALREGPGAEWGWESVWYDAVNACWRSFHHRFHVTHWHEMPGPPREPQDCQWCGVEVQPGDEFTTRRGELFCSSPHRAASNRALRFLRRSCEGSTPIGGGS